jgi:predicted dehydrogenase
MAKSAQTAGVLVVPAYILGRDPARAAPSNTVGVACVGCGGKGGSDTNNAAKSGGRIVALADPDSSRAKGVFNKFKDAKKFKDYRKMLDECEKDIDAVTVSTPDHSHFPAAYKAMMMGKHAFVQKPISHTVWEARKLTEIAAEKKLATQMGNQGSASRERRIIREWIESGAIGDVTEVVYWTNRPIWPQGIAEPLPKQEVPGNLDWDLWLGPAQLRDYNKGYCPFKWRGWWDFGCGALGDMACHFMDAAFWSLDLRYPTSVEAKSSGINDQTAPKWSVVTYQFPEREVGSDMRFIKEGVTPTPKRKVPPVKVSWYDGVKYDGKKQRAYNGAGDVPRGVLEEGRKMSEGSNGQFIIGTKATIMAGTYAGGCRIIPETKMKEVGKPKEIYKRSTGHVKEWIDAIKGNKQVPSSNFDIAGPLSEMVLMGNLAVRTGKKVEWDGKNMKCTNNVKGANELVTKKYRKGWAPEDLA